MKVRRCVWVKVRRCVWVRVRRYVWVRVMLGGVYGLSLVYASASRRRRTYAVDVTPSMSIRSSALRRRVALQFTARALGGCGGVFVWFQGVIAEALLFLPVTVFLSRNYLPSDSLCSPWKRSCKGGRISGPPR